MGEIYDICHMVCADVIWQSQSLAFIAYDEPISGSSNHIKVCDTMI